MNSKVEARVSHQFKASAERVYEAWLTPALIRTWMSASLKTHGLSGEVCRVEVDARVGGKFFFSDMRPQGEACHWGTYLELEPGRKIVFTWIVDESGEADPSKVTLTIEPKGAGCVVTIVHEMDRQWIDYVQRTEGGWSRMLTQVDHLLG
jgi:uncharacterized protein YndB with AHSA1/START domain